MRALASPRLPNGGRHVSRRTSPERLAGTWLLAVLLACAPADVGLGQAGNERFLQVDGARLYFEVAGHGEAVIFLHDGLTHGGLWEAQFRSLASRYRVVRYDRRGHGRSDLSAGPYSATSDLRELMDHLEIQRTVLVGASSGGGLALDYALAFPDRVSGLVLVGAVVPGYGFSEHFLERGRRNMAPLSDGDVEQTLENWLRDPYLTAPGGDGARRRLRGLMEPYAEKRFLDHRAELARPSGSPAPGRLTEIEAPTLVIVGAHDHPDVHAHGGVIEAGIGGSRRLVVPRAGHLVPLERPDLFNRTLLSFLRRH